MKQTVSFLLVLIDSQHRNPLTVSQLLIHTARALSVSQGHVVTFNIWLSEKLEHNMTSDSASGLE